MTIWHHHKKEREEKWSEQSHQLLTSRVVDIKAVSELLTEITADETFESLSNKKKQICYNLGYTLLKEKADNELLLNVLKIKCLR